MKRRSKYETLYRKNETNGNIVIEVLLDDYLDFFHEWDNAAFKRRDIHPELVNFLSICSEDIPLKENIEIQLCVKEGSVNKEKEDLIRTSFFNHYDTLYCWERKEAKRIARTSGILLLVALTLITLYVILSGNITSSVIAQIGMESLLIGGWVFAWEAIHGIAIDIAEPLKRRRELKRFLRADVGFKYLNL